MTRRGEVVLVSLGPVVGREQGKIRPAIVVSNDAANAVAAKFSGLITVVPLTSNVRKVFDFQVRLAPHEGGLDRPSKAQCEQTRSVSVERIVRSLGTLSAERMGEVDEALRIQLDL